MTAMSMKGRTATRSTRRGHTQTVNGPGSRVDASPDRSPGRWRGRLRPDAPPMRAPVGHCLCGWHPSVRLPLSREIPTPIPGGFPKPELTGTARKSEESIYDRH